MQEDRYDSEAPSVRFLHTGALKTVQYANLTEKITEVALKSELQVLLLLLRSIIRLQMAKYPQCSSMAPSSAQHLCIVYYQPFTVCLCGSQGESVWSCQENLMKTVLSQKKKNFPNYFTETFGWIPPDAEQKQVWWSSLLFNNSEQENSTFNHKQPAGYWDWSTSHKWTHEYYFLQCERMYEWGWL